MNDAPDPRLPDTPLTNTSEQASPPNRPALSPNAMQWLIQNQAAIEAFNLWYEQNGSPLDQFSTF